MKSAAAIGFDYRPSRLVAAGVVAVYLLSLLALVLSGLPWWSRIVLAIAAVVLATRSLLRFLRPGYSSLLWHAAGHWQMRNAVGQERAAELRHASVLGTAVVLTLRSASAGTVAFVLLPGNCDAETLRRLRVRLARAQTEVAQPV